MWIVYTLVCSSMVILNSSEVNTQFECLPDGAPIPGVPHSGPSFPAPDTQHPPDIPHSSNTSQDHAEPPLRLRSRSPVAVDRTPSTRLPFSNVLGYGFDQLAFIRLIPYKNPLRRFELRRYTFPTDTPLELLEGQNQYGPIPNEEQIVLSTSNGDVFAMLDGADTLAGLYTYNSRVYYKVRAKINMENGNVTPLTVDETREILVGRNRRILYFYGVEHLNHDHGNQSSSATSLDPVKPQFSSRFSSSTRNMELPTRLPASDGSGYELDQLQFIRLIPRNDPNQIFELRKYTFPADKLILYRKGRNHYEHVPIQELIVITKDSGEVFAVLENNDDLAGIYTYIARTRGNVRVKINMRNSSVVQLTKHEIMEVPVGHRRPIIRNFRIKQVNHDLMWHPVN